LSPRRSITRGKRVMRTERSVVASTTPEMRVRVVSY
jgi:hypothetical protein